MKARLNYVELPAADFEKSKRFYEGAFGWTIAEFGPTYAATTTDDVDIGLQGDKSEGPKAPLPVIHVAYLEAALKSVQAAGGAIIKPIFSFPGGRRFHFRDPSGNELAVWQTA
jgi:predicted enzyme related to lactoylglutathione lyase